MMKLLLPFLLSLLLVSCASRKISSSSVAITDTTHVVVTDTAHIIHEHDTTIVKHREVIHEKIVTLYDPTTGAPSRQEVDRMIQRLYDSIYVHQLDSIRKALRINASNTHNSQARQASDVASGDAAISATKLLLRKFSSIFFFLLVVAATYLALRFARR